MPFGITYNENYGLKLGKKETIDMNYYRVPMFNGFSAIVPRSWIASWAAAFIAIVQLGHLTHRLSAKLL